MGKKILIAENDRDLLLILNMVLSDAGYKVEALPHGISIVSWEKEWPDLFILDKNMPTIDGLALCKYLKLNKQTKDIPIIMISANHELKNAATKAGANIFIEKPFNIKNLLQHINKCCREGEKAFITNELLTPAISIF